MLTATARRLAPAAPPPASGSIGERADAFHYVLQPRLSLIADAQRNGSQSGGGVLHARRPLMAMRFNAAGFALLAALESGGNTAASAATSAGVTTSVATAFLDHLAERRLLTRSPPQPLSWPSVSIVVAAHGRTLATVACVRSLLTLDYAGEAPEIIIVDDASEPPLASVLGGLPIRLIRLDRNVGQSAARNLGAAEAGGEIVAFIDNDCVADPAWLRSLVPWFADPALAIVGGRVVSPPASGLPASGVIERFEAIRSPLDMGAVTANVGPEAAVAYLPTCNFLVRRDVFLAHGGFAAEMRVGEDVDFCWRVLASGWQATYAPAGTITHHHRVRLPALLRRRADYGASEADLQKRHAKSRRVLPLPAFCLVLLAGLTAMAGGLMTGAAALAVIALALAGCEIGQKRAAVRRLGLALPLAAVAAAVVRSHGAALWCLSGSATRYYGLPLAATAIVIPALWPSVALLLLAAPLIDHRRGAAAMPVAAFVGLYWLEMAAYQIGVWRGCLAARSFHPLRPILMLRR